MSDSREGDETGREPGVPQFPLSPNDLAVLDTMIAAYLAYLRGVSRLSRGHTGLQEGLQRLQARLRLLSGAQEGTRFLLTSGEIELLDQAIEGFARLCRRAIAPSPERDEALAQCERFRRDLVGMLDQANDKP